MFVLFLFLLCFEEKGAKEDKGMEPMQIKAFSILFLVFYERRKEVVQSQGDGKKLKFLYCEV